MAPLTPIGRRALARVLPLCVLACAAHAQTSSFNGRCQVTSAPVQVRAEGLAERVGDIFLQCSGATPGSVFNGNLTIFLPVSITNRVDAANLTRDAVVSIDTGGGPVPAVAAGQVSGNSISFNGLSFTASAGGG